MNPELPKNPREEMELHITALLLGELSADDAAATREAIAKDPELVRLHDNLKETIHLVREATASASESVVEQSATLKLSAERREKLLAHFKTVRLKEFAPEKRRAKFTLVELAAMLAIVAVIAAMFLPALTKLKSTGYRESMRLASPTSATYYTNFLKVPSAGFRTRGDKPVSPPSKSSPSEKITMGEGFFVESTLGGVNTMSAEPAESSHRSETTAQAAKDESALATLAYSPRAPVTSPAPQPAAPPSQIILPSATAVDANGVRGDDFLRNQGVGAANEFVSDPEWVGFLQKPDQPHSSDNRFVARYAYMAGENESAIEVDTSTAQNRQWDVGGSLRDFYDENVSLSTPEESKELLEFQLAGGGGGAGGEMDLSVANNGSADQWGLKAVELNVEPTAEAGRLKETSEKSAESFRFYRNVNRSSDFALAPAATATASTEPLSQNGLAVGGVVAEQTGSPVPFQGGGGGAGGGGAARGGGNADKAPLLGDVPMLGKVFRSESESAGASVEETRPYITGTTYGDFPGVTSGPVEGKDGPGQAGTLTIAGNYQTWGSSKAGVVATNSMAFESRLATLKRSASSSSEGRDSGETSYDRYAFYRQLSQLGTDNSGKETSRDRVGTDTLAISTVTKSDEIAANGSKNIDLALARPDQKKDLAESIYLGNRFTSEGKSIAPDSEMHRIDMEGNVRPAKPPTDIALQETGRRQVPTRMPRTMAEPSTLELAKVGKGLNASGIDVQGNVQPYYEKKRDLESLQRFSQILKFKTESEQLDVNLPKTSMVAITDRATPAQEKTGFWRNLGLPIGGSYASSARVKVEDNISDISEMSGVREFASPPYDSYFAQTESELIESEIILGKVVNLLKLDEAWSRQPGVKLNQSDAILILKRKLELSPVKNTKLIEIRARDENPAEAAKIANAVADAYHDHRLGELRQRTLAGVKVLEDRHAGEEGKIKQVQQEVERLRAELGITETQTPGGGASVNNDPAPVRKPSTNAPIPQPEIQTSDNAFSTFSLNVSDVSFKLAAASLEKGQIPDSASIRSEEFINAFDYRDPEPQVGAPIAFAWERAHYPFAHNRDLLRFSLKTAAVGRQVGRPLNIVLLLDNSGSMERADRVSIIREALRVLSSQLQSQDKLSVITFSRTARLVADGISGDKANEVAERVGGLTPQGGTNLEDAMNLAYQTALRHYLANGINRVVILTDGAANLGNVEPEELKKKVETYRKQGVALDCFGIGWDGYNDDLLEVLSRNGDGRYGFINSPEEATTQFAAQLAGALKVAASDVKVQVEFNPRRATAYRQIGYAKHQLTKEQFRDNTVDAAEIAAQEAGNALYTVEVNPAGEGPLCTVRVRYKVPGTTQYREQAWDVPYAGGAVSLEQSTAAMRLAASASAFSEWLAVSPHASEVTLDALLRNLSGVPTIYGADKRPEKLEWMIRQAKSLEGK